MREPIDITLGGRSFTVRPLTLRQVETIEGIVAGDSKSNTERGIRIVLVGLSRDHADTTADALYDAEITAAELAAATAAVLRQGGFLAGEAPAARSGAPTGAPSAVA